VIVSLHLKYAASLRSRNEAFDAVNHDILLYKLKIMEFEVLLMIGLKVTL